MADELIAVPRGLLEMMRKALDTASDSGSTIGGLCRIGVDYGSDCDSGTLFNAIDACMKLQDQLVCPACDQLQRLLSGVGDG